MTTKNLSYSMYPGIPECISIDKSDRHEKITLDEAIENSFRSDTGALVINWDRYYIPLFYRYDAGTTIEVALDMIEFLLSASDDPAEFHFFSSAFRTTWRVRYVGERILISAEWLDLPGGMEEWLRTTSDTEWSTDAAHFIAEWRHLFAVVYHQLHNAGYRQDAVRNLDRLAALSSWSPTKDTTLPKLAPT